MSLAAIKVWAKANPVLTVIIAVAALWLYIQVRDQVKTVVMDVRSGIQNVTGGDLESFSTCYQHKQIYLSSCDPDQPTGVGDVNLEQRWGKLYIKIVCNLPFALGGVFHTVWGAYYAVLYDRKHQKSINLGSLVRSGDRWYRLATELLGDYCCYDEIQIWRQTEDYKPKMVLKGSISGQQCSSL